MKRIVKFKENEVIPDDATFLKMETVENKEYSNHTWCSCHDLLDCYCYQETVEKVFYYEINE